MSKVLHVITGLDQGGAERQLLALVNSSKNESAVFSITGEGAMSRFFESSSAKVFVGNDRGFAPIVFLLGLRRAIKIFKPDVVMGWMYHGNIAASLSRLLGFSGPVVWNIRHSVANLKKEKFSTRLVIRLGSFLSWQPKSIVYNSRVAEEQHYFLGFRRVSSQLIPNGIDANRFQPNSEVQKDLRNSLGLGTQDWLLGVVGRSHPMKNHLGWLKAFTKLESHGFSAHCILIGKGLNEGELVDYVEQHNLTSKIHLWPMIEFPEHIYPGLDLLVSPSLWGEGFPNVVGEAMSCGVPAIVTDVGDSVAIVGKEGYVFAGTSEEEMVSGVANVLSKGKDVLQGCGIRARKHIQDNFSVDRMAVGYDNLFAYVLLNSENY